METIKIATSRELNIVKTFECGQCFRWNADEDGIYYGIVKEYPAKIWTDNSDVFIESNAPAGFWHEYFDMSLDYEKISQPFLNVPYLDECTQDGMGIRILNQEPWEALCSFIISQCNNIKRIKGIVERLCKEFGEEKNEFGKTFYTFPSAKSIAELKESDLECLRAGYRSPYILNAAKAVSSGELNLNELKACDYLSAKTELLKLNGIGEKVANCVVLFGLHHMEAFPVDVWIKRALNEHFPKDFKHDTLGEYAGLAQQYIFYHMRG